MNATLNVTWAKRSLDFNNVKFQFKWDVIKLCQAYLMQHVADTVPDEMEQLVDYARRRDV